MKKGLEVNFADNIEEVLKIALVKPIKPVKWKESKVKTVSTH